MITRVEVIERGIGRLYTNYDVKGAWIDIQDDGKTLKVFINEEKPMSSVNETNARTRERNRICGIIESEKVRAIQNGHSGRIEVYNRLLHFIIACE